MGQIRASRPSPAIIVAVLALVAALAGTGVAQVATTSRLDRNDKQTVRKIANTQITKRAPSLSVANAVNAQNAQAFEPGATLRSGETLSGVWALGGTSNSNLETAIQFTPQLPAALGPTAVQRITPGGSSAECPGQGQAVAGSLCLYERATGNATFNTVFNPVTAVNGTSRRGAVVAYIGTGTGAFADGTWTVTAP